MNYSIKVTHDIDSNIESLREEVFCIEQGFAKEIEINANEYDYTHISMYNVEGLLIAYCRYIIENNVIHLGRVVVKKDFRNKGIGLLLIKNAEDIIKNNTECKKIILHSQYQVVPFYEKCGYIKEGDLFLEDNYPHYLMIKNI